MWAYAEPTILSISYTKPTLGWVVLLIIFIMYVSKKVRRAKRRFKALVQSQSIKKYSIKKYYTKSIVTGPRARHKMLTVYVLFFMSSIKLTHRYYN